MIRLHNARIMPMLSPGDCSIVEGELWTDGGRISYVGTPREDMPAFEREIDLGGGFHCVWFDEGDMRIFRDRGLWAVTCPASNAKLASGVAPLSEFMDMGINLAIGTDGASSNNALDMFREMYLACVLQKLRREDAAACPAGDILYAACSGGARAMGLPDCDSLAPGKWADLAVINLSRPSMRPILAPAQNLVYSGSKDCVRLTMVAGRILYENGEFHVGDSVEHIIAEAEKYTKELI